MANEPVTTAIAPWFGCARMIAEKVGKMLAGSRWVGIPFAGGMPEIQYLHGVNTIVVNDIHRDVINLAMVMADPFHGPYLYRRLKRRLFHPDQLASSQEWCKDFIAKGRGSNTKDRRLFDDFCPDAAFEYFICSWMGRSAKSGTDSEFDGGLPIRWKDGGGDSNVRYRSAVRSINAWRRLLQRCNFSTVDAFDFIAKCNDLDRHAIYADPPSFPGAKDLYRYKFTVQQHVALAEQLSTFRKARVVIRFYDHPLVREWYPQGRWSWEFVAGRKQTNEEAPEVLIHNGH